MQALRRAVKRSSITLNKSSIRAFQWAINQGSTPPLTSSKWGKLSKFVVFLDNFDNKGRNVCCKVSLYKNSQRHSCSAINCLSSGINILSGGRPIPSEILAPIDLPPPEGSEFWHILPCNASTVRDRKRRRSIILNKTRQGLSNEPSSNVLRRP